MPGDRSLPNGAALIESRRILMMRTIALNAGSFAKTFAWILTLAVGVVVPGAVAATPSASALPVVVSVLPQKYFVERIGGARVAVTVMVLPGANPAVYEPKPQQMTELAGAACYFSVGVPFERVWLPRFQAVNRTLRLVDTGAGIARQRMAAHHHEHPAGDSDDHADHNEAILDPHIWLSPPLVLQQARTIWIALSEVDPAHASLYAANFRAFVNEIAELDTRVRDLLAPVGNERAFMVFHPAWGYFASAYGLEQWPVELEGKEPKAAELQEIIERARTRRVRVVFVQPQFAKRSAETIAQAIGARLVTLDPLAETWADNLLQAAAGIRAALLPPT